MGNPGVGHCDVDDEEEDSEHPVKHSYKHDPAKCRDPEVLGSSDKCPHQQSQNLKNRRGSGKEEGGEREEKRGGGSGDREKNNYTKYQLQFSHTYMGHLTNVRGAANSHACKCQEDKMNKQSRPETTAIKKAVPGFRGQSLGSSSNRCGLVFSIFFPPSPTSEEDSNSTLYMIIFFAFVFGCNHSMQKFPSLGSNPLHSSDNAATLTARPPGNSYT